jgi:hypothetical protein
MRKRMLAGLALVSLLSMATATLAQRGEADGPAVLEPARFVRAGQYYLNVQRIDYIEVQNRENGGELLKVYLIGRQDPATVWARNSADLLKAMRLPPREGPKPGP